MSYLGMIASTLVLVAFLEAGRGLPRVSFRLRHWSHGLGALFVLLMHAFAKTGICFVVAAVVWQMVT